MRIVTGVCASTTGSARWSRNALWRATDQGPPASVRHRPDYNAYCLGPRVIAMEHSADVRNRWPALDYAQWRDTLQTLHLWTQIVGKVRLAFRPGSTTAGKFRCTSTPVASARRRSMPGATSSRSTSTSSIIASGSAPPTRLTAASISSRCRSRTFYRRFMSGASQALGSTLTIGLLPNEISDTGPLPRRRGAWLL